MPQTPTPQIDFGRYLLSARRAKEMTLEDVSRLTKITTSSLRQIEAEDLTALPAPVFVKGFVRAYATAVGADVQGAIQRYEESCRLHNQAHEVQSATRPRMKFWPRFALAGILFLIVIGATLYIANVLDTPTAPTEPKAEEAAEPFVSPGPKADIKESAPQPATERPPEQPSEQPPEQPPEHPTDRPPAPIAVPEDKPSPKLVLDVEAVELTWLKVIADAKSPQEITLQSNEKVTLEADSQFSLLIGNAGGVRLKLNDNPVPIPGKSGQVVTIQLP